MSGQEFQLLLCCARSQPDAESITNLIHKGVDWDKLLELAEHHGVRPMLRQSLKGVSWDSVPQSTRFKLEQFYRSQVQRSLSFTGELLRLLGEFQQKGIQIVVFKGVILAETVYGDMSLREFSDLDIFVREADVPRAEDILTAQGYRADFPDRNFRAAFLSYQCQFAFRNKQTGMSVDLHWSLSWKGEAFPLRMEEIWSKVGDEMLRGRTVPTLAHDDLALFLAAHGTKEGWQYLRWVCDFAEFLRKYRHINWEAMLDRAEQSHSSRPLQLALVLASRLLAAPAPAKLIDKAWHNSAIRALANKAHVRMLRSYPEGELTAFVNGLNTHDRLRHRISPVLALLTTRTVGDYQAMPLPKSLWSIYYFSRPFRLAAKAAKMILHHN